jgi:hypothetical protein
MTFRSILFIMAYILSYGCSDNFRPKAGEPYEYMEFTSFDQYGVEVKNDEIGYHGVGLIDQEKTYFEFDKGQCEAKLQRLSANNANLSIQGYNYFLQEGDSMSPQLVFAVKVQCVAKLSIDEICLNNVQKYLQSLTPENRMALMIIGVEAKCRTSKSVGSFRVFSL